MNSEKVNTELVNKVMGVADKLRSLLALLNVMRSASVDGQDLTKSSLYCKTMRNSGKLSRELTDRLDTISYFIDSDSFEELVSSLDCVWNIDTRTASVKTKNAEEDKGGLHAEKGRTDTH